MAKSVAALSPQEQHFVARFIATGDLPKSYAQAGYQVAGPDWQENAATLARRPAIVLALHVALGRQLALDAATARAVALELMTDKAVAPKVRSDLAVKIMRMGGHVEPKHEQRDTTSDKSLAELSMAELRERAEALERELSERAKPIISVKPSATDDEPIDMFE